MPHRSTIDALPDDVRTTLNARLLSGDYGGYDSVADWLSEQGYQVSRSSVGRYALRLRGVAEQRCREIEIATRQAEVIVGATDGSETEMARAAARLLQQTLFRLQMEGDLPVEDLSQVSLALARVVRSEVWVERLRRELAEDVARKVEAATKSLGLSDPAADAIQSVILGTAAPQGAAA